MTRLGVHKIVKIIFNLKLISFVLKDTGLNIHAFLGGVGASLGYILTAIDWKILFGFRCILILNDFLYIYRNSSCFSSWRVAKIDDDEEKKFGIKKLLT